MELIKKGSYESKIDYIDHLMEEFKKEHPFKGNGDVELNLYEKEIYDMALAEYKKMSEFNQQAVVADQSFLEKEEKIVSEHSELEEMTSSETEEHIITSVDGVIQSRKSIFQFLLHKISLNRKNELMQEVDDLLNEQVVLDQSLTEEIEEETLLEEDKKSEEIQVLEEDSVEKIETLGEGFIEVETLEEGFTEEVKTLEKNSVVEETLALEQLSTEEIKSSIDELYLFLESIESIPGVKQSIEGYFKQKSNTGEETILQQIDLTKQENTLQEDLVKLQRYVSAIYQIPGVSESIQIYQQFHQGGEVSSEFSMGSDFTKTL